MSTSFVDMARLGLRISVQVSLTLAASVAFTATWAVELSGTSTSLVYRGPSTSISKPGRGERIRIGSGTLQLPGLPSDKPPSGLLRLVDARNGREISSARYNPQIQGFFFQMPAQYSVAAGPVCLAIRGTDQRTLPLREEASGDDGFEFRHVPWEEWVRSKSGLPALQAELAKLRELQAKEDEERQNLHQKLGFAEGAAPPVCQLGPAQAPPPRPAWAISEQAAATVAHGLCLTSLKTELAGRAELSGGGAMGLVSAAGLAVRPATAGTELPMPSSIRVSVSADLQALMSQALKVGPRSLEHEQALEGLRKSHEACQQDLQQYAISQTQQWQEAVKAAANAPQTAKANCEQGLLRLNQLRDARTKGMAYRQVLENKLRVAQEAAGGRMEMSQLEQSRCTAP